MRGFEEMGDGGWGWWWWGFGVGLEGDFQYQDEFRFWKTSSFRYITFTCGSSSFK